MKYAVWLVMVLCVQAQTTAPRATVTATGQATVPATPDQLKIDLTVTTQGASAQEASAKNANQVALLVAALQKLLGSGADLKTVNYSVNPIYRNGPDNSPTIVGFSANLTTEVTLGTISLAGAVIDTAASNGATNIGSPQFALKDPEPPRLQALRMATMQARNHADAMAAGAGRTTGDIISLQESTASTVIAPGVATGVSSTTIMPGLIQVQATVVLQAALN